MSMNFSEFSRILGSDPTNQDPEFLRARESSPEAMQAASESDDFERQLKQAVNAPAPADLVQNLQDLANPEPARRSPWREYAIAASLLLAVAAAGITWRANHSWESVEQYVMQHYNLDGDKLVLKSEGLQADNVEQILAQFQVAMAPEMDRMVSLIKYCPTPEGKGAHMVVNTENGPITIIYMPDTQVTDGEMLEFNGMKAQLVSLETGSAAIIGTTAQPISSFYTLVQNSIVPLKLEA
jgi:hypothetical protein